MENWKSVKGYEDLYEVSDLGRVRRKESRVRVKIKYNDTRRCRAQILKLNLKRSGRYSVDLCKENKKKTVQVHRLVAIAFCKNDNPDTKIEVDHINGNKKDNRACNLEWVTPRENKDRAMKNHLYYNPNKKRIYCKELNKEFISSYSAAEYLNEIKFKNTKQIKNIAGKIRSCCCGIQKTAYGLNWQYV